MCFRLPGPERTGDRGLTMFSRFPGEERTGQDLTMFSRFPGAERTGQGRTNLSSFPVQQEYNPYSDIRFVKTKYKFKLYY